MKRIIPHLMVAGAGLLLFFSCSKIETMPISEVVVGKWIYEDFTVELDGNNSIALKREVDSLVKWCYNRKVADDFSRVVEFTAQHAVALYNINPNMTLTPIEPLFPTDSTDSPADSVLSSSGNAGSYDISDDTLTIRYDGTDGFPVTRAYITSSDNNRLNLIAPIGYYLDFNVIFTRIAGMSETKKDELLRGRINLAFKRYAAIAR